jgi:hypothetical protein
MVNFTPQKRENLRLLNWSSKDTFLILDILKNERQIRFFLFFLQENISFLNRF